VTTWKPPNPLEGVTGDDFETAARAIRAGNWKESIQAKDWVGIPIAKALDLKLTVKAEKAKVRGLIEIWVKAGSLVVVQEKDPARREMKKFVRWRRRSDFAQPRNPPDNVRGAAQPNPTPP